MADCGGKRIMVGRRKEKWNAGLYDRKREGGGSDTGKKGEHCAEGKVLAKGTGGI